MPGIDPATPETKITADMALRVYQKILRHGAQHGIPVSVLFQEFAVVEGLLDQLFQVVHGGSGPQGGGFFTLIETRHQREAEEFVLAVPEEGARRAEWQCASFRLWRVGSPRLVTSSPLSTRRMRTSDGTTEA